MDILPLEVKLEEYSDDELLLEGNDQQQRMLYARDNLMRILDQDVEGDNGSTSPKAKNSVKSKTPLPMGQRVPCSYCDKTFKSWAIYRLHEKIHTGEGVYTCDICSKIFGQRSHYVDHVAIHSSVRPFSCSECTSCFKEKNTLRRHQQRKHGMHGGLRGRRSMALAENQTANGSQPDDVNLDATAVPLPQKVPLEMRVFVGPRTVPIQDVTKGLSSETKLINNLTNSSEVSLIRVKSEFKTDELPLHTNPKILRRKLPKTSTVGNTSVTNTKSRTKVSSLTIKKEKVYNISRVKLESQSRSSSPELTINDFLRDD